MGTPMGGFIDRADVVFKTATPTPPAATQGVPAKALIPSSKPVPIGEGTYTERVSETAPTPAEAFTPQEGAIPPVVVQIASPATPFVISNNDPFATLSQAVKDGSFLVVTPSSIPSSATRGFDTDLSFERSEDVLKDHDDESTMKKRVSDSKEEENAEHEAEFMGMHLLILLSSLLFFISTLYTYVFVSPLFAAVSLYLACLFL